ncbi:MAG: hypothetical protein LBP21_09235 [Synergistaceae bacterium]|jgi:hypothetical protein|nr:hypothetical protein [Synergistaceae bacterium]
MTEKRAGETFSASTAPRRVAIQTRFDEETFAKGKVLAAIYDESFNAVLVRALKNEIRRYEARYGKLPPQIDPEDGHIPASQTRGS